MNLKPKLSTVSVVSLPWVTIAGVFRGSIWMRPLSKCPDHLSNTFLPRKCSGDGRDPCLCCSIEWKPSFCDCRGIGPTPPTPPPPSGIALPARPPSRNTSCNQFLSYTPPQWPPHDLTVAIGTGHPLNSLQIRLEDSSVERPFWEIQACVKLGEPTPKKKVRRPCCFPLNTWERAASQAKTIHWGNTETAAQPHTDRESRSRESSLKWARPSLLPRESNASDPGTDQRSSPVSRGPGFPAGFPLNLLVLSRK